MPSPETLAVTTMLLPGEGQQCGETLSSTRHAEDGTGTLRKTLGIPGSTLSTGKNPKSVHVQNTSYSTSVRDLPLKTVQDRQTYNTRHPKQMKQQVVSILKVYIKFRLNN